MAFGQVTKAAQCKECGCEFASKMVFGQMTTRCNNCRDKKGFAYKAPVQVYVEPYQEPCAQCVNLLPCQTCPNCGKVNRDFS